TPQDSGRAFAEAQEFAAAEITAGEAMDPTIDQGAAESSAVVHDDAGGRDTADGQRKRRRRGRRGGRRRRRGGNDGFRESLASESGGPSEAPESEPVHTSEAAWSSAREAQPWSERTAPASTPELEARPARPQPLPQEPRGPEPPSAPEPDRAAAERPAEPAPAGAVNVPPPVTV